MTTTAAAVSNLSDTLLYNNANLYRSVASGQLTLVQRLIADGCDPNLPHLTTGLRPIHFAASRGHVDLVKYLVETSQCQVDATDKEGETALLKAAYAGHLSVVMYLVNKANANYLHQDRDGWTALHNACSFGSIPMTEFLLNQPLINVNVASKKGHTPLMNAASKGHVDIVVRLLQGSHANPMLKNKFGEAAYDVAAAAGEAYLCQVLEKYEMQYGLINTPLDVHVTIPVLLLEVVADNSSYINLFGKPITKWYHHDRVIQSKSKVALPNTSWFWLSDWTIDYTFPDLSYDGWSSEETDSSGWIKKRRWVRIMKKVIEISTEEENDMHDQSMSNTNSDSSSDSEDNHSLDLSRHSTSTTFESKTCTSVSTTMTKAQSVFIGCSTLPQPLLQEQMSADNIHQIIPVEQVEEQQQPAPEEQQLLQDNTLLSWESNEQALDCRRCHRWFNFLTRRHHCRKCGQVICDRCSANRALLPSHQIIQPPHATNLDQEQCSQQPQRICDTCVDTVVCEISKNTKRRASSIMSECPVCSRGLGEMHTEEQEEHVQACLSKDASKINAGGIRYVVYKLTPSSTLIGRECVICFEEFESGDTLTRLNCMCSYHGHCIGSWFAKGKECPIHSQ
ncbi:FYVE-domain-containing protein [Mucor ambiguus]|uniref:FYVE-domain-containing protein n=1 Tax=Mucor ambiguus TaxID=91626 RepID=A0A0C9MP04_9FUNG|nr:FYVE-domain-containing protein [Mucor ambiguus]